MFASTILKEEPEAIEDEQHKEYALILIKKQRQRRLRAEKQAQTSVINSLEEQVEIEKAKLVDQEHALNDLQAEIDMKERALRLKWAYGPRIQELEQQLRIEIASRQTLERENQLLQHLAKPDAAVHQRTIDPLLKDIEGPWDTLVKEISCFGGRAIVHAVQYVFNAQGYRIDKLEYEDFYGLPPDIVYELFKYGGCDDLFNAMNIHANVQCLTDRGPVTTYPQRGRSQVDRCWEQIQVFLEELSTPEEYRLAVSTDWKVRKLFEELEEKYREFYLHPSGNANSLGG